MIRELAGCHYLAGPAVYQRHRVAQPRHEVATCSGGQRGVVRLKAREGRPLIRRGVEGEDGTVAAAGGWSGRHPQPIARPRQVGHVLEAGKLVGLRDREGLGIKTDHTLGLQRHEQRGSVVCQGYRAGPRESVDRLDRAALQVGHHEAIVTRSGGDVDPSPGLVDDVGGVPRERQGLALLQHRVRDGWRRPGDHQAGQQDREAENQTQQAIHNVPQVNGRSRQRPD